MLEYFKPTAILLSADAGSTSTSSCGSDGEDNVLDDMLGGSGDSSAVCKFAAGSSDGSGDDSSSGAGPIFS